MVFAIDADGSSLSLAWAWAAASLLLATALGFAAGVMYANRSADRTLRKAIRSASSLCSLTVETLERALHATSLLEKFPQLVLNGEQLDQLDKKRESLLEMVTRIVGRQRESIAARQETVKPRPKPEPLKLEWQRSLVDSATGLPDRAAFDLNLAMMLEAGAATQSSCGILLVKIDRIDQLKSRFGILGADIFAKTMAALISRAVRERDLACRLGADSFGVLLPSVDAETGRKLSQAIRNLVRVHIFRLQETGPEVLVTASFGYATCVPADTADLALTRAGHALAQSIRRGRNQLHVFDGESVVYCTSG